MSAERVERILDAAYHCFTRHGVQRTTMDDIAVRANMSRPAVYQYVRNKEDAFRRLVARIYDQTLAEARAAVTADGDLAARLDRVLAAKLSLTQRIVADSPHSAELIGHNARFCADLDAQFMAGLVALIVTVVERAERDGEITALGAGGVDATTVAELAVALTRGLEADLSDERRPRQRLRQGLRLLVAGLTAPSHLAGPTAPIAQPHIAGTAPPHATDRQEKRR